MLCNKQQLDLYNQVFNSSAAEQAGMPQGRALPRDCNQGPPAAEGAWCEADRTRLRAAAEDGSVFPLVGGISMIRQVCPQGELCL